MSYGYPLHQCGLYALKSPKQLAARLGRSSAFVQARSNDPTLYRVWNEPKSRGGFRTIEAPRADLKALQRRIADLLQRVLPPDYLYSPVKRRSYIDNAAAHQNAKEIRLLDISDYFGNCTAAAVYGFFHNQLKCQPHVAWLLTGLATREGHLPQGSPCSPILSFYSCSQMWAKIAAAVHAAGCKITIYVDDITVSGSFVPEELIWRIKQILHTYGHSHQRSKERRRFDKSAEITGIMVGPDQFSVPHRHYKKLKAAREDAHRAVNEDERAASSARARSLEAQIQHIVLVRRSSLTGK